MITNQSYERWFLTLKIRICRCHFWLEKFKYVSQKSLWLIPIPLISGNIWIFMPKSSSWNVTTDFFFNFWQILDDFYPLCYSPDISIPVSYLSRHIFEGGPDRLRTILYLTRRLNCVEMNLFQSHMLCHWQGILIWCGKMCERNISHSIQKSRFNVSLDDFLEFYLQRTKILCLHFDDGF